MIDEYMKFTGAHGSADSDTESDYQKLFTTHKYKIIEENQVQSNSTSILKQIGIKSTIKPTPIPVQLPNPVKFETSHSIIPADIPSIYGSQPEKKRGRPPNKDKEKGEKDKEKEKDEAEVLKKRKKNKKREGEEGKEEGKGKEPKEGRPLSSNTNLPSASLPFTILKSDIPGHSLISPAKDNAMDKLRKYEETISKYEDYTQGRTPGDHLDMVVPNLKNIVKSMNLDPMRPPTYGQPPTHGYADDSLTYNKIFQELLKMSNGGTSMGNPPMMGDNKNPPNLNFYQPGNFK